ncbi:MAG: tetratricopeptide repeat protein [Saccharothrix sp.]|nr:tetratricopeptide repeat protein [Saccharothrix sp.]
MDIRFAILGQTALRLDGHLDTQWGPPKLRALLAVLLARPGVPVPSGELADWIWTEDDLPANPPQVLYLYSSRIRRVLKEVGGDVDIVVDNRSFRLDVDPLSVDYFSFQDRVREGRALARRGEHQRALETIGEAFRLWRQRPLADLQGPAAEQWRERMRRNVLLPAYETLFAQQLALGEADAVIARMDELALEHRSHLALFKRRLEALHAQSRQDEATEEFLAVHKQLSADFDDIAARDLREFHDRLKEAGTAPRAPLVDAHRTPDLLPPPVPHLVGHETLLAKLDAVTARPGLVVVDGVGGVGKTALVVHWAHTARERFPGGVLHADLHGSSDRAAVEDTTVVDLFLEALGVAADRIPDPHKRAAKLQAIVSSRPVLVVLDDVRDTDHVRNLVPLLTSAVVVVVSRSHLSGLATRQVPYRFPVVPLDPDQSVRLLSEHIGHRTLADRESVAHLAKLCGGLPLALKVLAQYVAARPGVPMAAFAEQLGRDIRLLDLGAVGDGANHGPRAVFTQQVRALAPEVRRLFRLAATHPGPDFGVAVAAAMTGSDARRTRLALDALVEANLVQQAGALGRFAFHDLVREYAVELITDARERRAAELAALDFYVRTAENADKAVFPTLARARTASNGDHALDFADADAARQWCVAERHNLIALMRHSAEAGHTQAAQLPQLAGQVLLRQGYAEDSLALLHLGLDVPGASTEEQADTLYNIAQICLERWKLGEAEHHVRLAHAKYAEIGDEVGIAACLLADAQIRIGTGDLDMAVEGHERALRAVRGTGERGLEAVFLYRTGEAHQRGGALERAATYYRESLALARDLGDLTAQGRALVLLGTLSFAREQSAEAHDYLRSGLLLSAQAADVDFAARACWWLSRLEFERGRTAEATAYGRQATRLFRRLANHLGEAEALRTLGAIFRETARYEAAVEALEQATALLEHLDPAQAREAARELSQAENLLISVPATRRGSPVPNDLRHDHRQ